MDKELEQSRKETKDAFKNRGVLYRLLFEEMSKEFGEEKSAEVMKKTIYRWGGLKSHRYKTLADNNDFKGVAEEFIKTSVCAGEVFHPSIHQADAGTAVVDMASCPLVEAWQEMGLSSDEIKKMCEIANATDYGKYETMGFNLEIETTVACGDDCCRLRITPGEKNSAGE